MSDSTGPMAKLLGFAGVEVDTAEQEADGSWTLYVTTTPGRHACCTHCGREVGRVKELMSHSVRHMVVAPVRVVWGKNRYFCEIACAVTDLSVEAAGLTAKSARRFFGE